MNCLPLCSDLYYKLILYNLLVQFLKILAKENYPHFTKDGIKIQCLNDLLKVTLHRCGRVDIRTTLPDGFQFIHVSPDNIKFMENILCSKAFYFHFSQKTILFQ